MTRQTEGLRKTAADDADQYLRDWITIEPPICSHFGCGIHLTRLESLYGDKCLSHSKVKRKAPWDYAEFQIEENPV